MVRLRYQQPELPMFTGRPVALDVPGKPSMRMDEVSRLLGCSNEHVRHLIEDGSLAAVDIACKGTIRPAHRVVQASVVEFVKKRMTVGGE
ncbi:MAG: hypothetical protein WC130_11160 [Kiritimatiellia bacterium]